MGTFLTRLDISDHVLGRSGRICDILTAPLSRKQKVWQSGGGIHYIEVNMKLFEPVDPKKMKSGAPPLVFIPPATGHIVFQTHEELKAWEDEVRTRLGVELKGHLGTASRSEERRV